MRSIEEEFYKKAAAAEAKKLAEEAKAQAAAQVVHTPAPVVQYQAPPPQPQPQIIYAPPVVQTIEKTSKDWKGQMVLGVLLMVIGIFVIFSDMLTGGCITLGGGLIYMRARVMAWWHHG